MPVIQELYKNTFQARVNLIPIFKLPVNMESFSKSTPLDRISCITLSIFKANSVMTRTVSIVEVDGSQVESHDEKAHDHLYYKRATQDDK